MKQETKQKPIWIELVDNGVANRFNLGKEEVIEINWRLTGYPNLYKRILKHELKHDAGKFSLHDFKHDMMSKTPGLHSFMMMNPSTWTQLLPIYWDSKRRSLVYDWSNIFSWTFLLIGATSLFLFLRWAL